MARQGMEHWWRAVVVTLAGIFVVSLVGGVVGNMTGRGGTAVPAARPTTRSAAATHTAGTAITHRAVARADGALLRLSDLPSGWVSGAAAAPPTRVSPWSKQLAACVKAPARAVDVTPTKVSSPDFVSADKTMAVEDAVSVYPSAADARAQYDALATSRTPHCMDRVAGAALQSTVQQKAATGTTVGAVTFAALPHGASAHHLTGFTVTVPLSTGGQQLAVSSTQVDFVTGPLLHQVTFNGNGTTFPAALEEQLLATAQSRH